MMSTPHPFGTARLNHGPLPTAAQIEAIARQTVEALPDAFRGPAREVALIVAERPSHEMLHAVGLHDPMTLTGLYEGVPMTRKTNFYQPLEPDTVWLFRAPILAEWRARRDIDLEQLVAHVTTHEFAHHFGWSDDDIASIDRWWE